MYRKLIVLISFVLLVALVNTTFAYVASDPNADPNWGDQPDFNGNCLFCPGFLLT